MNDKDDELGIMADFKWALKDPTEEKLRELGEVVSIITTKLIDAFGKLERRLDEFESSLGGLETKVSSLDSKVARGVSPAPGDADPSPAAAAAGTGMASAPMASAPKPKPAGAGGGMSMMGELKALLAARRVKSETPSESE